MTRHPADVPRARIARRRHGPYGVAIRTPTTGDQGRGSVHELSLCRAIADTVADHAAGRRVETVQLRVGHFRQVVPDTLAYCWELTSRDTPLAGSTLAIEEIPAVVHCRSCGADTVLELPVLRCGTCDGIGVELVSGEEFLIASIDVAGRATEEVP